MIEIHGSAIALCNYHLVMTNRHCHGKIHPFLSSVNHLFLWAQHHRSAVGSPRRRNRTERNGAVTKRGAFVVCGASGERNRNRKLMDIGWKMDGNWMENRWTLDGKWMEID